MYRVLKIHPGWTVEDYMNAPADYVDWALQFHGVEAEVAEERQRERVAEANRKARRR